MLLDLRIINDQLSSYRNENLIPNHHVLSRSVPEPCPALLR